MTMKVATRKSAPAAPASEREVKQTLNLVVVKIDEEAREVTANGKKQFIRDAVVLTRNGEEKQVSVWGTELQWDYFNGKTIEAQFASSDGKPFRWYFSPVAGDVQYTGEDDF